MTKKERSGYEMLREFLNEQIYGHQQAADGCAEKKNEIGEYMHTGALEETKFIENYIISLHNWGKI